MATKNIVCITDLPMFGKQGQKGVPSSSPGGRKIIPFPSLSIPPSATEIVSELSEAEAEEACRFLQEELRLGNI